MSMLRPRQAPPGVQEVQAWLSSGFIVTALKASYSPYSSTSTAVPQFSVQDLVSAPHTTGCFTEQELPCEVNPWVSNGGGTRWAQWADEQPQALNSFGARSNTTRTHHEQTYSKPHAVQHSYGVVNLDTSGQLQDFDPSKVGQPAHRPAPPLQHHAAPPASGDPAPAWPTSANIRPHTVSAASQYQQTYTPRDSRDPHTTPHRYGQPACASYHAPQPAAGYSQQPQHPSQPAPDLYRSQHTYQQYSQHKPAPPPPHHAQPAGLNSQPPDLWDPWSQLMGEAESAQPPALAHELRPPPTHSNHTPNYPPPQLPARSSQAPHSNTPPSSDSRPQGVATQQPTQQHSRGKLVQTQLPFSSPPPTAAAADMAGVQGVDVSHRTHDRVAATCAWPAAAAAGVPVPAQQPPGKQQGKAGKEKQAKKRQKAGQLDGPSHKQPCHEQVAPGWQAGQASGAMPGPSGARGSGASKVSKVLAGLKDLSEDLDLPDHVDANSQVVNVCQQQGLLLLKQQLGGAQAVVVGLVYACSVAGAATQFYCSTQQGLTRPQQQLLRKARNALSKVQPVAVKADELDGDAADDQGSGTWDTQVVGVGLVCVPAHACTPSAPGQTQASQPLLYLRLQALTAPASPAAATTPAMEAWSLITKLLIGTPCAADSSSTQYQAATAAGVAGGQRAAGLTSSSRPAAAGRQCAAERADAGSGAGPLVICPNSKAYVREMIQAGVPLPQPYHDLQLMDPCVLAWLAEPHLMQKEERSGAAKELVSYQVIDLLDYHHLTPAAAAGGAGGGGGASQVIQGLGPLQRLRHCLLLTPPLIHLLTQRTRDWLPPQAVALEMKVSLILGSMEARGVGLSTQHLTQHAQRVAQRITQLRERAEALAGRVFNPGSAAQLADVLYTTLKLQPPSTSGKTHASTDESTLKQLSAVHPLPGVILDYRCMNNLMTKWLQPPWAVHAVKQAKSCAAGASGTPRVYCSWNALATATGRLSSSSPNLQAVTKYTVQASTGSRALGRTSGQVAGAGAGCDTAAPGAVAHDTPGDEHVINVRDAFVAPDGCVLISGDYSQIELRVLAHLSGDPELIALLHRAGAQGDVFQLIAASWLKPSTGSQPQQQHHQQRSLLQGAHRLQQGPAGGAGGAVQEVSKEDREVAKRIVYGILYGLTPYGLHQQLMTTGYGVDVPRAQQLIKSFLSHFSGVSAYIDRCNRLASQQGYVTTLTGRRRPLPGLAAPAGSKVHQEAKRRVVNSIVQGSAADLIKLAMLHWEEWCCRSGQGAAGGQQQQQPVVRLPRLVAQIHDELLIECAEDPAIVQHVARGLQAIMSGVVALSVPLTVNLYLGKAWGTLDKLAGL